MTTRTPTSKLTARNAFRVHLVLARRPLFICCCIGLWGEDALRFKRILKLTRAITASWRR